MIAGETRSDARVASEGPRATNRRTFYRTDRRRRALLVSMQYRRRALPVSMLPETGPHDLGEQAPALRVIGVLSRGTGPYYRGGQAPALRIVGVLS